MTPGPAPADDPAPAFRDLLRRHPEPVRTLVEGRLVQTNEVRRCTALLPGLLTAAARAEGRPLALIEVGASAGLNLRVDRYRYEYAPGGPSGPPAALALRCEARGPAPVPRAERPPAIVARLGIDLAPVDPRDPDAVRWLHALVWPEHADRAERLRAALALAAEDPAPVPIEAGDALDVLPRVALGMPPEAVIVVTHSATLAHLPPDARVRFGRTLEEIGAERRVMWLPMEGHRALPPPLAALIGLGAPAPEHGFVLGLADLVPGQRTSGGVLAHAHGHGAWIAWGAGAVSRG